MCYIIAHRSPRVDQQNSASEDETDQPEDPAVGTKRARIMPGSKIVLPSSNVEEYSGKILRDTISHIVNPKGMNYVLVSKSSRFSLVAWEGENRLVALGILFCRRTECW